MVGIVVVSHSRKLAEGVAELSNQMTQGRCALAIAGGVDDPDNPIGTDAIAVMQAIEEVCDEQGALVLMDMGSALLSTEMALELIDPEMAEKVVLCSAPVVEGTMAASVAAASGLPLAAVKQEAQGALAAKQEHLGETAPVAEVAADSTDKFDADTALQFEWLVRNPAGLHARPTAAIIAAVAGFEAEAELRCGDKSANAKSLNSIATLGVKCSDTITLHARGADAAALIEAFKTLAEGHFNESIDTQPETPEATAELKVAPEGAISGLTVCEGVASGDAIIFTQTMPTPPERLFTSVEAETQRLNQAVAQVEKQLGQLTQAMELIGDEQAAIFDAHSMMLTDPDLLDEITGKIAEQQNVEQATYEAISELAQSFKETDSDYMQAREADVWDIGRQLLFTLSDEQNEPKIQLEQPSIVLAEELSPSNTAMLDPDTVLAVCLSGGNTSSHSAILARAKGIPTIFNAEGCLQEVEQGQTVRVDAGEGLLWLNPELN